MGLDTIFLSTLMPLIGSLTCKTVSQMTYIVLVETLKLCYHWPIWPSWSTFASVASDNFLLYLTDIKS